MLWKSYVIERKWYGAICVYGVIQRNRTWLATFKYWEDARRFVNAIPK